MIIEPFIEYFRSNPKQAMVAKIVTAGLATVLVLGMLATIPTSSPISPSTTSISADSHPTLQGDELRYFNGISFIKINTHDSKASVISKSARLPGLGYAQIVGDHGAITTLTGSFGSTAAEKFIESLYLGSIDTIALSHLAWYVDFSNGEISAIPSTPPDTNGYFYDASKNTAFYTAPYIPPLETGEASPLYDEATKALYSFDPTTKTVKELARFPEVMLNVKSLSPCGDNGLCVVAESENNYNLFRYNNDKIENVLKTPSRIFSTNNQSKFVLADQLTYYGDIDSETDSKKIVSKISEYDIQTKKESSLGISANNITNLIPLYNKSSLTLYANFGHTELQTIHRSPSIVLLPNISKSSKKVDNPGHLVDKVKSYSYADNSMILSKYDGSIAYAGPGKLPAKPKTPPSQLVQGCVQQHGSEVEYTAMHSLYTLYVPVSGAFAATVEQIGDCILKNPSDTFGYTFQVMGTSPESGRIITD